MEAGKAGSLEEPLAEPCVVCLRRAAFHAETSATEKLFQVYESSRELQRLLSDPVSHREEGHQKAR